MLSLAILLPAAGQKSNPGSSSDIEVDEFTAIRDAGHILVDSLVWAKRETPIPGLRVKIKLLAPGGKVTKEHQTTLTGDVLEAGDDVTISLACPDRPDADSISLDFYTANKKPLTASRRGPHMIE